MTSIYSNGVPTKAYNEIQLSRFFLYLSSIHAHTHIALYLYIYIYFAVPVYTVWQWFTPIWFLSYLYTRCLPPHPTIVAVVVVASTPLCPVDFNNNKTTDCMIKTTSINHKRVYRSVDRKKSSPTNIYMYICMCVCVYSLWKTHRVIYTRGSHHWFSEHTVITERCKLRCFSCVHTVCP